MKTRVQRKAVLTLEDGSKIFGTIYISKQDKPVFHKELERKLVEELNQSQPNAVNKVVNIHLMRN